MIVELTTNDSWLTYTTLMRQLFAKQAAVTVFVIPTTIRKVRTNLIL